MKHKGGKLTIKVDMELNGNILSQGEAVQVALNEAGMLATQATMEAFDTNGEPITVKGQQLMSKGSKKK